jgi:hypothetical protein
MVSRPKEVPSLRNCGYDYCQDDGQNYKSDDDILTQPTLPEPVLVTPAPDKPELEKELLSSVKGYMDIDLAIAILIKASEVPADELSIQIPGGILPVEQEAEMAQRVHTLVKKADGFGYLRSPGGKERPLTKSDIDLFKGYFVNLGKTINAIRPVTET